jgi:hypothetical protein
MRHPLDGALPLRRLTARILTPSNPAILSTVASAKEEALATADRLPLRPLRVSLVIFVVPHYKQTPLRPLRVSFVIFVVLSLQTNPRFVNDPAAFFWLIIRNERPCDTRIT